MADIRDGKTLKRFESLFNRGKEVLLNCLEAGLDAYEDDEDMEACSILNDLIGLLKKEN